MTDRSLDQPSPVQSLKFLLSSQALQVILYSLVSIFLARYLGPLQYGNLSLVLALIALVAPFKSLGLRSTISVKAAQSAISSEELFNSFAFESLAGIVIFVLILVFTPFVTSYNFLILALPLLASDLLSSFGIYSTYFTSVRLGRLNAYGEASSSVIRFLLVFLSILSKQPLFVFVLIEAFARVVSSLVAAYFSRSLSLFRDVSLKYVVINQILRNSLPFFVSSLSIVLFLRTDEVMLGFLGFTSELGIYVAFSKPLDILYRIFFLVGSTYMFQMYNTHTQNELLSLRSVRDLFWALGGTATIILFFNSQSLAGLVYGSEYKSNAVILSYLSLSIVPFALNSFAARWLSVNHLETCQVQRTLIAASLNILLNLLLIPQYGAVGASVATLLSYVVQFAVIIILCPSATPLVNFLLQPFRLRQSFQ